MASRQRLLGQDGAGWGDLGWEDLRREIAGVRGGWGQSETPDNYRGGRQYGFDTCAKTRYRGRREDPCTNLGADPAEAHWRALELALALALVLPFLGCK